LAFGPAEASRAEHDVELAGPSVLNHCRCISCVVLAVGIERHDVRDVFASPDVVETCAQRGALSQVDWMAQNDCTRGGCNLSRVVRAPVVDADDERKPVAQLRDDLANDGGLVVHGHNDTYVIVPVDIHAG
jgi:hypothetical protein